MPSGAKKKHASRLADSEIGYFSEIWGLYSCIGNKSSVFIIRKKLLTGLDCNFKLFDFLLANVLKLDGGGEVSGKIAVYILIGKLIFV